MDYVSFVLNLVKPLVTKPEDVEIQVVSDTEGMVTLQVNVNPEDIGRVIGKKGRVINSIRTLVYACAARAGQKTEILIDKKD